MTMERNTALFDKIAAAIEEQPDRYDQTYWAKWVLPDGSDTSTLVGFEVEPEECGTTMCIAGWAVFLTEGTRVEPHHIQWVPESHDGTLVSAESWRRAARTALGLTHDEAEALFDAMWADGLDVGEVAEALRAIGRGANPKAWKTWNDVEPSEDPSAEAP